MNFEERIDKHIFNSIGDKSFLDKVFSRADSDKIEELIKKPQLKREELLQILYLLSGIEIKQLNYTPWDRYILAKYYVWIREFVKVTELLYDYQDNLKAHEKEHKIILSDRTKQLLSNAERRMEHNAKFLIDLYFNLCRSTLSVNGTGFLEALKQKFELVYPNMPSTTPPPEQKRGWFK